MPSKKTKTRATRTGKEETKACDCKTKARELAEARAEVVPAVEGCCTDNSVDVDVNCNNSYNLATIGYVKALLCRHNSSDNAHDGRFDELAKLIDAASESIYIKDAEYGTIESQIFADGRWYHDGDLDHVVSEKEYSEKIREIIERLDNSDIDAGKCHDELKELIARNNDLITGNTKNIADNQARIQGLEDGFPVLVDRKIEEESDSIRADLAGYADKVASTALVNAKLHADNAVLEARRDAGLEHEELGKRIDGKVGLDAVGTPGGVASLGVDGTVPVSQLPDSVRGCLKCMGEFAPVSGPSARPPSDNPVIGQFFVITANGTYDGVDYLIGDWILCAKTEPAVVWKRVSMSADVVSVNGKTGEVQLTDSSDTTDGEGYWTSATVNAKLAGKVDVQTDLDKDYVILGGDAAGKFKSSSLTEADLTNTKALAAAAISSSEKGAVNGVATLDENGKIKDTQLPDSLKNSLRFRGTWDGRTQVFSDGTKVPDTPTEGFEPGFYWITDFSEADDGAVPNSVVFPSEGGETYTKGDWLVVVEDDETGKSWSKVDVSNDVSDVEGQRGSVKIFATGEEKQTSDNRTWTAKDIAAGFAGVASSATVGIAEQKVDASDGVLNIPVADTGIYGVSKVDKYFGITVNSTERDKGKLVAVGATDEELKARGAEYPIRLITSYNLDKAVKFALVGNSESFSEDDKTSARTLIGATLVEIVDYDDE